jgi:outer membrane protein assembly factor BamB
MSRATRCFTLCGAAILALASAAQNANAPASPPGQTTAPPGQNAPAVTQNPAANAAAVQAERRMRAAIAAFLRGESSWGTAGADAQRSSWVRTDPKISPEGVQKPEFKYLWKVKLPGSSARANSLSPAVLLNRYIGYRGFRDLAFLANAGVGIYAVDIDLGRIEWAVHDTQAQQASSCSAGDLNGVARPLEAAFPTANPGFGYGRGGPAHAAVGQPNEGAVTLAQAGRYGFRPPPAATPRQPGGTPAVTTPPPVPPAAASASGAPVPASRGDANAPGVPGSGGPAPRPPRPPIVIYVLSADGMLHTMYVSNGQEPKPAVPFLPPDSAAQGFIVVNDVAYAATVACNGGASSLVALDLKSGAIETWKGPSEIAGQDGPAFGPNGTVYVTTVSGDLFALDPKTLEVKDTLKSGEPFVSSPVIFQYRQRALGVAALKNGSLLLFDTRSPGGEDHKTPLFKTEPAAGQTFTSATVSSWMDDGARRWVLLPAKTSGKGGIAAWQVKEQNGSLSLELGWTSREIASPSAAMIINGVVFAASNADPADAGNKHKSPSVIYALDGKTGKELWNSGKAIASSAHNGSLSGGASQIYLGADDGNLYAFGAWIEREDITP